MSYNKEIARHIREVYFGKNWTAGYLRQHIDDVTWQEAVTKIDGINTIASLVYHIHYYLRAVQKVFDGENYYADDQVSFDHPPIESEEEWQYFLQTIYGEVEAFAQKVEDIGDDKILKPLDAVGKDSYFRKIHGIIEHAHYHIGQIAVIKKLVRRKQ